MKGRMYKKRLVSVLAALVLACVLAAAPAYAQCEDPSSASNEMDGLASDSKDAIEKYMKQEKNFTDQALQNRAAEEVLNRFNEYHDNLLAWLNDWAGNRLIPTLKEMTTQLSLAQIEQTTTFGAQLDALMQNETIAQIEQTKLEAYRRMVPSEGQCELDTIAPKMTKGHRMARGLARVAAKEADAEKSNTEGTPAEYGAAAQMKVLWDDYVTYYCDPSTGDQGCTTAGTLAGLNNDFPALLWGDKQTIDMATPENSRLFTDLQKYLINPFVEDPIPEGVVGKNAGIGTMLDRRANQARMNVIYNAIGQMLGERAGGADDMAVPEAQDKRIEGGINAANTSGKPSYRELSQVVGREKFANPDFIVQMVNYPSTVLRDQGAVNAIRLQQLNDLYKRMEEMLWVETTVLSIKLDSQKPADSTTLREKTAPPAAPPP